MMARYWLSLSLVLLFNSIDFAQSNPGLGVLPYATRQYGVDLATSNVVLSIPLRSKAGKIPFSSNIVGTSQEWPVQSGSTWTWTPSLLNGFTYEDPTSFALTVQHSGPQSCDGGTVVTFSSPQVVDLTRAKHGFPSTFGWKSGTGSCVTPSTSAVSTDGSGYTLVITNGNPTVYSRSGNNISGTCSTVTNSCPLTPTLYDADGYFIKSVAGVITDSLNTQVGTVTTSSFAYTDASGNTQKYIFGYTTLPLATNFGCSNSNYGGAIAEFSGSFSMLTSITLPITGEQYTISYESTVGMSGHYTGRIGTITFPTGGSITYQYLDNNGHHGMDCNSFVVPQINVTVNDNNGNSGQWQYVNSNDSATPGNYTLTETDPAGNQTLYNFSGEYLTEGQVYQGTIASGVLLSESDICYNGNNASQPACDSPTSVPVLPFSKIDLYTHPVTSTGTVNAPALTEALFDQFGNTTIQSTYDFGATFPPSASTPSAVTTTTYGSYNITTNGCDSIGTNIQDRPCSIITSDGAGNVFRSSYMVNQGGGGHVSTVYKMLSNATPKTSTNYLQSSYQWSNGVLTNFTDPSGNATGYSMFDCNNVMPKLVTYADGSTVPQMWDCNGGLKLTAGSGSSITSWSYMGDPLYRLMQYTDQLSNATNFTYGSNTVESAMTWTLNGNTSTQDTLTTSDGLGRPYLVQKRQQAGGSNWNTVQTSYNNLGQVVSKSQEFVSTQGVGNHSALQSSTITYDALGRVTSTTDGGGGYKKNIYNAQDVLTQLGPAPLTNGIQENLKQRQYEYNGLGELVSVCEITAGEGTWSGYACNQNNSEIGYLTSSNYDAVGELLNQVQNGGLTTSGPNAAGTGANMSGPGATWSTPQYIGATGTVNFATATTTISNTVSQWLDASQFGFNLTSTSQVTGLQVQVQASSSLNGQINLQAVKGGTLVGTQKQIAVTSTLHTYTLGGKFDLWGTTWAYSDINNNTGFGIAIEAQQTSATGGSTNFKANSVTITVYFANGSQQVRTYAYDMLGRMISATNPESGTKVSIYDTSDSNCNGVHSLGDLMETYDAMGNVTCMSYDPLHRLITETYPVGPYHAVTPGKYFAYDTALVNGVYFTNYKKRRAEEYTCAVNCPIPVSNGRGIGSANPTNTITINNSTLTLLSPNGQFMVLQQLLLAGFIHGTFLNNKWITITNVQTVSGVQTITATAPNGSPTNYGGTATVTMVVFSGGTATLTTTNNYFQTGEPVTFSNMVQTCLNGVQVDLSTATPTTIKFSTPVGCPVTYSGSDSGSGTDSDGGSGAIQTITDLGYQYDLRGSPTQVLQLQTGDPGVFYEVDQAYAPNGVTTSLSFPFIPGNPSITYNLDGMGRANNATYTISGLGSGNCSNCLLVNATYWSQATGGITYVSDQVSQLAYGNTETDAFGYDPTTSRMISIAGSAGGSSCTSPPCQKTAALTWNANGSLQSVQYADTLPLYGSNQANNTCTYIFDDLERVISETCPPTNVVNAALGFDPFGNVNTTSGSGETYNNVSYNVLRNQLVGSGCSPNCNFYYFYDATGNLTCRSSSSTSCQTGGSGTYLAAYDSNNKLVCWNVSGACTTSNEWLYDTRGRFANSTDTFHNNYNWVYTPAGNKFAILGDSNGNGADVDKMIVPLPGGARAVFRSTSCTSQGCPVALLYYSHPDWRASTFFTSDPSNNAYSDFQYAAFGQGVVNTNGLFTSLFSGMANDIEPDEFHGAFDEAIARMYDPLAGRWTTTDPAGQAAVDATNPQTLNRYNYATNNPLSRIDPKGLVDIDCSDFDEDGNCVGGGGGGIAGIGFPGECDSSDPTCAEPPDGGCDASDPSCMPPGVGSCDPGDPNCGQPPDNGCDANDPTCNNTDPGTDSCSTDQNDTGTTSAGGTDPGDGQDPGGDQPAIVMGHFAVRGWGHRDFGISPFSFRRSAFGRGRIFGQNGSGGSDNGQNSCSKPPSQQPPPPPPQTESSPCAWSKVAEESTFAWGTGWGIFGVYNAMAGDEPGAAAAGTVSGILYLGSGAIHVGRWLGGC
jgi:RHS repeat-associated protein